MLSASLIDTISMYVPIKGLNYEDVMLCSEDLEIPVKNMQLAVMYFCKTILCCEKGNSSVYFVGKKVLACGVQLITLTSVNLQYA